MFSAERLMRLKPDDSIVAKFSNTRSRRFAMASWQIIRWRVRNVLLIHALLLTLRKGGNHETPFLPPKLYLLVGRADSRLRRIRRLRASALNLVV